MVERNVSDYFPLAPSPTAPYTFFVVRPTGLSKETLNDLIERGEQLLTNEGSEGKVGGQGQSRLDPSIRRSKIAWMYPQAPEYRDLYQAIGEMCRVINAEMFRYEITGIYDAFQFTKYTEEDQGTYDWHLDIGPSLRAPRKLSFSVCLSDPEEFSGGVLELHDGQIRGLRPQRGDIVFFPAYVLHRVTAVTRGIRRSLVGWAGGPSFR